MIQRKFIQGLNDSLDQVSDASVDKELVQEYIEKYKSKMQGSTESTARGWVEGSGANKSTVKAIWEALKKDPKVKLVKDASANDEGERTTSEKVETTKNTGDTPKGGDDGDSKIENKAEFKSFATKILKKAHGEDYDPKKAEKFIGDLIAEVEKGDLTWEQAAGKLQSSLGDAASIQDKVSEQEYAEAVKKLGVGVKKGFKQENRAKEALADIASGFGKGSTQFRVINVILKGKDPSKALKFKDDASEIRAYEFLGQNFVGTGDNGIYRASSGGTFGNLVKAITKDVKAAFEFKKATDSTEVQEQEPLQLIDDGGTVFLTEGQAVEYNDAQCTVSEWDEDGVFLVDSEGEFDFVSWEDFGDGASLDSVQDGMEVEHSDLTIQYQELTNTYGEKMVTEEVGDMEMYSAIIVSLVEQGYDKEQAAEMVAMDLGEESKGDRQVKHSPTVVEVEDSIASNKRAGTVLSTLLEIDGIDENKARAILSYHGSLTNLNAMSAQGLRKYKALKDLLSEEEANAVVKHLKDRKCTKKVKKVE